MKLTKADRQHRQDYEQTEPKQMGNLHERMKYVMSIASEERELISGSFWQALCDLQLEVLHHVPANPPYGRRTMH